MNGIRPVAGGRLALGLPVKGVVSGGVALEAGAHARHAARSSADFDACAGGAGF